MDLQGDVRRLADDRGGLVTRAALAAAGFDVRRLGACPGVHRVVRGVWASAPLPPWPRFVLRDGVVDPAYAVRVAAALLSLGPRATAGGRTAAVLHGWGLLVEPRVVEAVVPHGRRPRSEPWVSVRQASAPGERVPWRPPWEPRRPPPGIGSGSAPEQLDGEPATQSAGDLAAAAGDAASGSTALWVLSPLGAALDCLLHLPLLQAVVAVDSALRAGAVAVDELTAAATDLRGVRQAARARRALALCDARSGSVLESVLRFRLAEAGLTGFVTQRVVRSSDGDHVLRVDICFEGARLVLEADGSRWHPDPALDRVKDNRLAAAGWRVIRVTWADVVRQPQGVVALVRAALAAGQAPGGEPVAA